MIKLRSGKLVRNGPLIKQRAAPVYASNIVSHGDSISRDLGLSNYLYVLKGLIATNRNENARAFQRGINGISYDYRWPSEIINATLITDAPTVVDPERQPVIPNWLIVFAGTNGMAIAGHTAAEEYADFKTYIAARVAAGWAANRIIVCTMLPRAGFTDSIRQTFNASLVGDDGAFGYRLARLDLNANIGGVEDSANATYFYDGIHPTAAGHAIVAQIIYTAMFP